MKNTITPYSIYPINYSFHPMLTDVYQIISAYLYLKNFFWKNNFQTHFILFKIRLYSFYLSHQLHLNVITYCSRIFHVSFILIIIRYFPINKVSIVTYQNFIQNGFCFYDLSSRIPSLHKISSFSCKTPVHMFLFLHYC